jgi:signal transduction histidine kinase
VQDLRRVIAGLRPTALDDFGIVQAMRLLTEELQLEGWEISYRHALETTRLPQTIETALFRVTQEALNNVRKHAGGGPVSVVLEQQGSLVRLQIEDHGRGFDPSTIQQGRAGERVGLRGMQDRISLLGGRFHLTSRPGQGTCIIVELILSE